MLALPLKLLGAPPPRSPSSYAYEEYCRALLNRGIIVRNKGTKEEAPLLYFCSKVYCSYARPTQSIRSVSLNLLPVWRPMKKQRKAELTNK